MKNKVASIIRKVGRPSKASTVLATTKSPLNNPITHNIINSPTATNITQSNKINFLISLLTKVALIIAWFSPFLWLKGLLKYIFTNFKMFISSFRIIKDAFDYLNGLYVFQLFRNTIRILSIFSLVLNIIILCIFTEFNLVNWFYTLPGISNIGSFVYEKTPEKGQDYFHWLVLKIKTFLLWIWNGILDYIKSIIKAVLGSIENDQDVKIPKKREIQHGIDHDYFGSLKDHFEDYKYYYIIGSCVTGVIIIGVLGYVYWDSICSCWRRDPGNTDDNPPIVLNPDDITPEIHGLDKGKGKLPSPDSSSQASNNSNYSNYFRSNILSRVNNYREKIWGFMKNKAKDPVQDVPTLGIYHINGKDYWKGMPLPRTEIIDSGTEFYFIKNNNNTITVINNSPSDFGKGFILDANFGRCIYTIDTTPADRLTWANQARNSSIIFNAPDNSFAVNPLFGQGVSTNNPFFTQSEPSTSATTLDDLSSTLVVPTSEEDVIINTSNQFLNTPSASLLSNSNIRDRLRRLVNVGGFDNSRDNTPNNSGFNTPTGSGSITPTGSITPKPFNTSELPTIENPFNE